MFTRSSFCLFHLLSNVDAVMINRQCQMRPAQVSSLCPTTDTYALLTYTRGWQRAIIYSSFIHQRGSEKK